MPRGTHVSILLALVFVALIAAEQDRPWKRLQVEYHQHELTRLRAFQAAEIRRSAGPRDLLRRELEDARFLFEGRQEEESRLEGELRASRHAAIWAEQDMLRLQARGPEAEVSDLRATRRKFEEHERTAADLEQRLSRMRADLDVTESRWRREAGQLAALEQRIQRLDRNSTWWRIPGWRGLDPSLKVAQIEPLVLRAAPPGSEARVDRCTTCHLGVDRGEAYAAQVSDERTSAPFAPHPGDLVGEATPHPVESFGCTVCHGGNGRATDFSRAGHWPVSQQQEVEWTQKWGFNRDALPDGLILPLSLVASACVACHDSDSAVDFLKYGQLADDGRRLTARMGCGGCHATGSSAVEGLGPPLGRLAAKTTREWTFHWIQEPRSFRSTTWMPHLFDLELGKGMANGSSLSDGALRRVAEIRGIVQVLWSRSDDRTLAGPHTAGQRSEGDVRVGETLFLSIGCTGCHLLDEDAVRHEVAPERLHGPNLARIGNKVDADWLFAWLLDPRSHRPDTAMPDLRLNLQQASDLVAFLMSRRDFAWDDLQMPQVDPAVRDQLVLAYLEKEFTLAESAARMAEMSTDEKDLFLGERSLSTYGCLNCHAVPGMDEVQPKAAPLADISHRPARLLAAESRLVLAHRPLPNSTGPESRGSPEFRGGPDYGLSRSEADALLIHLLGFPPHDEASHRGAQPRREGGREEDLSVADQGWYLIERYNCLGCHQFEERGGGMAPDLTSLGARLQSPWLLEYLHDPGRSARRPWLSVRMPSFHFAAEEAHALVAFFAARDHQPTLMAPFAKPAKRDLAVGRAVATMLQCDRCHQDSPDIATLSPKQFAPSYDGVRLRLRPEWMVEWILDPQQRIPGTGMPSTFAKNDEGELDASYLTATIAAPMFQIHRARLLPLFDSEAAMMTYLADSRRVAEALRDYLWSREE